MGTVGRPRKPLDDAAIVTRFSAGESETNIARTLRIGRSTVHLRLVSSGTVLRSAVEASDLLRHRRVILSEETVALIDGLLLGDASVDVSDRCESRLEVTQTRRRVEWLNKLAKKLTYEGLAASVSDRKDRGFQLRTGRYATLTDIRKRWYPIGKKRIPYDVRITPISLAHWYWGDGCTNNNGYRMTLCTDGFTEHDVRTLILKMRSELEIRATLGWHVGRPRINITTDRDAVVAIIKPYMVPCMAYKLQVKLTKLQRQKNFR